MSRKDRYWPRDNAAPIDLALNDLEWPDFLTPDDPDYDPTELAPQLHRSVPLWLREAWAAMSATERHYVRAEVEQLAARRVTSRWPRSRIVDWIAKWLPMRRPDLRRSSRRLALLGKRRAELAGRRRLW